MAANEFINDLEQMTRVEALYTVVLAARLEELGEVRVLRRILFDL